MKHLLTSLKTHLAALRRDDPTRFRFLLGLAIAALIFLVVILVLDAPWEGETGKRVAADKKLHVIDYARIGSWKAAATNFGLCLTLLLTSRWWWPWSQLEEKNAKSKGAPATKSTTRLLRLFTWLGLLAALGLALWIRVPQMNRFLMLDEQDNLRRSIHGYAEIDKDTGDPTFVQNTWTDAFFENRLANNPVLMSVTSKASLTLWQKFSGKGELYFSRPALRLPSLIGGLLSIVAFWWFVTLLGFRFGAVLTAFVLALHPYHIDYCIQARGYGLMFLFVGTASCCALLALRTGRWRWFAGLGLSLALVLASYSGATYFVLTFGVALALMLGFAGLVRRHQRPRALLVRLMVVGALSGGLYYQIIAPSLPQISAWMLPADGEPEGFSRSGLGEAWIPNAYTHYTTGAWLTPGWDAMDKETRPTVLTYLYDHVFSVDISYTVLALVLIPLFSLVGFVLIWRHGPIPRAILLGGCIAPVVAFVVHTITGIWLHGWYILYFLPFFAIMLGCGLAAVLLWVGKRIPAATPLLPVLLAAAFLTYFWLEVRPGKPGRRALQISTLDPHTGKNFTVFTRGSFDWVVYEDGRMIRQRSGQPIPETFPFDPSKLKFEPTR